MPLKLIPPRTGKTPFWSVRGTHLGVYVDKTTKLTERRKAQKLLVKWRDEIERGEFAQRGEPTFVMAALAYIEAGGERLFIQPLVDHFGDKPLRLIDQRAIDDAAHKIYPTATHATRNRQVYTPISAILKRAGIDQPIKRPPVAATETFWLWPEQAFDLINAASAIDIEFGILLKLLCYTGMRLGEALGIKTGNVRLGERFIYLAKTKNKTPRPVFLPDVVVEALGALPRGLDGDRRVFRFTKSGYLYGLLDRAAVDAGLVLPDGRAFHILRHTWATWMRRYGGSDTAGLVATMAWKDRKSASRYEHTVVSEDAMKASLLPVDQSWKVDITPEKPQNTADR